MSRSGYCDDFSGWSLIMYRGQVASAIRGKRGQAFLRELIASLDAMPDKQLIVHDLQSGNNVCAIGSVGLKRGVDMSKLDPEQPDVIAETFGIAEQLVREIEYENDEVRWRITPEERWQHMRAWAVRNLKAASAIEAPSGVETGNTDSTEGESAAPSGETPHD